PFTQISSSDILQGTWKPVYYKEHCLYYLQELEKQGEFPHTIWPEHCIAGSFGNTLDPQIYTSLIEWSRTGKWYETVIKGTCPLTEHFGIFMAQLPLEQYPETQPNFSLLSKLAEYDTIFLAGEAKSHCVATSLKQMLTLMPTIAPKIVVLTDCMSNVPGLAHLGDPIYQMAINQGVKFADSTISI
ncbi:MAG: nicotinamidase, partial [Bacteroidia bacterium]|nr:nicotinamidase [Bacteroidia bacterium]